MACGKLTAALAVRFRYFDTGLEPYTFQRREGLANSRSSLKFNATVGRTGPGHHTNRSPRRFEVVARCWRSFSALRLDTVSPDDHGITRPLAASDDGRPRARRPCELEMKPMRWPVALTLGIALVAGSACATTRSNTPSMDPDLITQDQIARSKATNAYDVIATISPKMFTAHGAATTRGDQPPTPGRQALPVVVYVDNVKVGPIEDLKAIGKLDLREIRYLSPRAATDRWGEGHAGGVIYVTTVQGVGPDTTDSR